jgi:hypothetical protein
MAKEGWGGKRKGAGHPKSPYPLRIIKIACTEEELQRILAAIPDTRRRAELLLSATREDGQKAT